MRRLVGQMLYKISHLLQHTSCDRQELDSVLASIDSSLKKRRGDSLRYPFWDPLLEGCLERVDKLRDQWMLLRMFIEDIPRWSDADMLVEDYETLTFRVEAIADELTKEVRALSSPDHVSSWRLPDLRSKLDGWIEEISSLDLEIARALESILEGFSSVRIHSPLIDLPLWVKFGEFMGEIRGLFFWNSYSALKTGCCLKLLTSFIRSVNRSFTLGRNGEEYDGMDAIEGLFARVAPLVFRAVCVYSLFWFRSTAAAMDSIPDFLCSEILPVKPNALDFFLDFLKALRKISYIFSVNHLAEAFLSSSIMRDEGRSETFVFGELKDLIIFLIDEPIIQDTESVYCFAEIRLVVPEMISVLNFGDLNRIRILRRKAWIRRAEHFLQAQLVSGKPVFELLEENESVINHLVNALKEWDTTTNDQNWKDSGKDEESKEDGSIRDEKSEEDSLMEKKFKEDLGMIEKKQEDMVQIAALTSEVASRLTSVYQSFHAKEIEEYMARSSISRLLSNIVLFRARIALVNLLDVDEAAFVRSNDLLEGLLQALELFTSFVRDEQVEKMVDGQKIYTSIQAVARRIISMFYSTLGKEFVEDAFKDTAIDLLERVEAVKVELRLFHPQIRRAYFPNNFSGIGLLDSLLGNLFELVKHDPDSTAPFKKDIELILKDLELLRSSLASATPMQQAELVLESEDLGISVSRMIYESNFVIDSIEVGIGAHWQHLLWLHDLQEEIKRVNVLVTTKLKAKASETSNVVHEIPKISSQISTSVMPEKDRQLPLVTLLDQEDAIIDRLTRGSSRRDVVSIVGMPGLGKTTIAKKVFDNPKVAYHFHPHAWCIVSQSYVLRDLLIKLLRDIQGFTNETLEMNDSDLKLKLYRCLKKKRYLIFMDDVWDVEVWKEVERSFPDDGNGSRIMITTRLRKVALDAMPGSDPHSLRPLSHVESWTLMEMRIFQEAGCCPGELVDVGKEIAEHCKGLPLAVVAIAGILEKTERKYDSWKRVSEELNTRLIDDPVAQCRDILELSYNHLPAHLKACFLYFATFQEDRDIPVRKLIRLWVAEGFIPKTEVGNMEEIGEGYLRDLIDRSLVMISKMMSTGGMKTCRIHGLFLDLCRSTSKGQNFLELITRDSEPYPSFYYVEDDVDFDHDDPSNLAKYESHRVCIFLKRKHFVDSRPSGPCTRSLMFHASNDAYSRRPYNVSFIFENFRLLKVLDLESINLGTSIPAAIDLLLQLRYLALSGDLDSMPQSISNLWKLETLILKGLSGKIELPESLWTMKSLRHVHVRKQAAFNLRGDKFEISFQLENLVTFSTPTLSYGKDTEKILRKLPNLQKFKCIFLDSSDIYKNCNPFPRFDFLSQLESLNILYFGRSFNPRNICLPSSIRKLTLSKFRLSTDHLSAIGKLPKLKVLKIISGSLEEPMWDMREDEFRELKFLKLDSLNIVQWNASSDYLPQLEHLVLWNCINFEKVPYELFDICALQMVEVRRCSQSLEEYVRNIEVEGLQVHIPSEHL